MRFESVMYSCYYYDFNCDAVIDRYWRPGPRARSVVDTKYTTYGFAYIQDMVDHAIIRLHANVSQEVGVVLQQFPYPCWVYDRFVGDVGSRAGWLPCPT